MLGPNVIVGLCILGAVFVCVAIAAMAKICLSRKYSPDENLEDLFRPHTKSQIDRLREVRWINLMYVWEAGRMAKYEMGERVDPRPRKRGVLLGGGLGNYSGYYGNVPWEEGVDDWDSEETSGGRQSAVTYQDYSSNAYHNSIGDGTANPYAGGPLPPPHIQQPKPKQSREAYNELNKSDDEDADESTPFPILHGLPEHARVQLKLPREQEFAKESLLSAQQRGKKSQHDVRPVSDMSVYYEQAEADEYAAAAQKRKDEEGQQMKGQDDMGRVGETIELSEIPRIVLNDIVVEEHIGRAS